MELIIALIGIIFATLHFLVIELCDKLFVNAFGLLDKIFDKKR